jgi:protein TonB
MATATFGTANASWDWFRVGAWSGSLAVHAFVLALVLIAAPAMIPATKPAPEPVIARWIEPELPPPALPEPPPPVVPHHVRQVPVRVPPQATTPVTPESIPLASTSTADLTPASADNPTSAATSSTNDTDIGGGATQTLAYATPLLPKYPPASARAREQGTVMLRVLVDESGVPQRVEIARSSGHQRLDAAARDSVMHARFRPVMRNGEATSAWGLVPIAFRLDQG